MNMYCFFLNRTRFERFSRSDEIKNIAFWDLKSICWKSLAIAVISQTMNVCGAKYVMGIQFPFFFQNCEDKYTF